MGRLLTVALPQARPAIAVGVSLALMECLNDIGAVGFFGVRTLSLGIYTTWLGQGNLGGAAQIAAVMLVFVFALMWVERAGRRQQSFAMPAKRSHPAARRSSLPAGAAGSPSPSVRLPIFLGFILPGLVLLNFALRRLESAVSLAYVKAAGHSLVLSATAAAIAVLLGLTLAYANRLSQSGFTRQVVRLAGTGYAIPGTVLGHRRADSARRIATMRWTAVMRENFGISTGLLLSGSIAAVTFAYVVRFLAISLRLDRERPGEGDAQSRRRGAHPRARTDRGAPRGSSAAAAPGARLGGACSSSSIA